MSSGIFLACMLVFDTTIGILSLLGVAFVLQPGSPFVDRARVPRDETLPDNEVALSSTN